MVMSRHYWNQIKTLRSNKQGIVALEYALVAPLFFILLFMIFEVAFMLIADITLERAASKIVRMGKIGIEGDCQTTIKNELDRTLSFWADINRTYAEAKIYTPGENYGFGNLDDENYQPVCDAGERGDMVVYRLGFEKPGITGLLSMLGIPFFRFERIVVIQNEP